LSNIFELYEYNVHQGPLHEDSSSLPEAEIADRPVRYLAYYLPQFHSIALNDEAWGKGFTEWTNATKALPRYVGHYQPRLPADLGFYNLNDVDVIKSQVSLAKRGGIYGFCFHYYWFSGQQLLDKPLSILLENPEIDMPFCINWANENWTRTWDAKGHQILIEQKYTDEDPLHFAQTVALLMQDSRYIKINGRPLVMLYRPAAVPNLSKTLETWRQFLNKAGVGDPYIIMPQTSRDPDPRIYGLDGAAGFPPHMVGFGLPDERWLVKTLDPHFVGTVISYDKMVERAVANRPTEFPYFPAVCPGWDNIARRPKHGFSFYGATPEKYGDWLRAASKQALEARSPDERIVFINAWNEWAEGAYLEPDQHFGFAYLAETRRILQQFMQGGDAQRDTNEKVTRPRKKRDEKFGTRPTPYHQLRNFYFAVRRRFLRKFKRLRTNLG
jgi:hypothetical protein